MAPTFHIEACGRTDVGRQREHNEDCFGCHLDLGLFFVADGMGGHSSGYIASECVTREMPELFRRTAGEAEADLPFKGDPGKSYQENRLVATLRYGNQKLVELIASKKPMWNGMATTVAALSIFDGRAQIAHVGDSRVYLLRGSTLEQLTLDHSLVNDYKRLYPDLDPEMVAQIPQNVITRSIGFDDKVLVDSRSLPLDGGDVLLVCSDGLTRMVPDRQITALLLENPEPARACDKLIEAANNNGGADNVTCVVVRVTER